MLFGVKMLANVALWKSKRFVLPSHFVRLVLLVMRIHNLMWDLDFGMSCILSFLPAGNVSHNCIWQLYRQNSFLSAVFFSRKLFHMDKVEKPNNYSTVHKTFIFISIFFSLAQTRAKWKCLRWLFFRYCIRFVLQCFQFISNDACITQANKYFLSEIPQKTRKFL